MSCMTSTLFPYTTLFRSAFVNFRQLYLWKKAHPGEKSPLFAFMVVINMAMWVIASLGVAISVVALIIPWSLGMTATINVLRSEERRVGKECRYRRWQER